MAERRFGPFAIESRIGAGGMGVVYRARYVKNGRKVALKLLTSDLAHSKRATARFDRELEILRRLRHANIVRCYGGGTHEKYRFYAMELVEGGTMAELLKKRRRLTWEDVIEYGRQICSALQYAHEHNVIHRDLKPANLLLDKRRRIKLADFGVARDLAAAGLTAAGATVGTFNYMAPEQIRDTTHVTHKSDLYSLGCVLYRMLTGSTPFSGNSSAELMYQHLDKTPERVGTLVLDCPVWLDALVMQLLAKDPDRRPRDAAAVSLALEEVRQRATTQVSVAEHTVSGRPSSLTVSDGTILAAAPHKKKRAQKAKGPVYERPWFLALCLLLVASVLGVLVQRTMWPSEPRLFAKAAALYDDDTLSASMRVRRLEQLLGQFKRRFPESHHTPEVQEFLDELNMERAEQHAQARERQGRPPRSETERLYVEARKYEQFSDRVTALEKYRAMVGLMDQLVEDDAQAGPYINLARKRINEIEAKGDMPDDRRLIVEQALSTAQSAYESGNVVKAREIWHNIVTLYEGNREMLPLVDRARTLLDDPDSANDAPPSDEETKDAAPTDSLT